MNELNTDWHPEKMLEVQLKEPDDFLKVRETLTRIGVASRKDKKLFQNIYKSTFLFLGILIWEPIIFFFPFWISIDIIRNNYKKV